MVNIFKLDTAEGYEKYTALLSSFDYAEPYSLLDYIDIFSGGLKNLICFSFAADGSNATIAMPGYLKPIIIGKENTGYFDFITPYGYSGPFLSTDVTASDLDNFWIQVDKWHSDNNVISEFIRFNLSGNQGHYSGEIFPTMLNVKGQILDEEDQWKAFDHKVRKNVNRAKRESLSSQVFYSDIKEDKISEFYGIYIQTMKRTAANESFHYTIEEFVRFINDNKNHAAICTIYFDTTPISSELLLVSADSIYSFLGGTDDQYFDKRPNDFLKVEALNWARNLGKKYYVLGGGYGFEDGIFKYKKSFFPDDVVNYYTGRKIINKTVYEALVKKVNVTRLTAGLSELEKNDSSFFPLYNKVM